MAMPIGVAPEAKAAQDSVTVWADSSAVKPTAQKMPHKRALNWRLCARSPIEAALKAAAKAEREQKKLAKKKAREKAAEKAKANGKSRATRKQRS